PESGIRSSGSILWSLSTREPMSGFILIPSFIFLVTYIIGSLPSLAFLYLKDEEPRRIPLFDLTFVTLVVTFFLLLFAAIVFPIHEIPSGASYSGSSYTYVVLIAFVLIPFAREELKRKEVEDYSVWAQEPERTTELATGSAKVGMIMLLLALFAPHSFVANLQLITFQAPTWLLYLSFGMDKEIWFAIWPFTMLLFFMVPYLLSFVFSYKVWMTSRGLAKESTTIFLGLLSLVVVPISSIFSSPFMFSLPFPLLFCVGLLLLAQSRKS
ncbi:MAG: hypothetical protein ACFFF4_14630, partial [Candidatus Thorarchaeota archaeon]